MINDDLSEDIKQVFYNLIKGEKSRDEAAAWANSVLAEDKLAILSSAHVDALFSSCGRSRSAWNGGFKRGTK